MCAPCARLEAAGAIMKADTGEKGKTMVQDNTPRPKLRRERPGRELKPGSRAAFARGCRCFTIPAMQSEGNREHQCHCPLWRPAPEKQERNIRHAE